MLKNDSREIKKGDTFIALKGIKNDGHKYVSDAIKNGASKVIVECGNYKNALVVKDTDIYLREYIKKRYLPLIKNLKLIGITGTNGKTTTSYLIYQALNKLNIRCAYIGTIGFYINGKKYQNLNTTPDILRLYQMLLECIRNNINYVVMEVSSQGLAYNRLEGLLFDYAVFTNLTIDHLDFHKTMDNYLNEKKKLFLMLKNNGVGIINSDDKYSDNFYTNHTVTYGASGDYKIDNIKIKNYKTTFTLNNEEYEINLIGKYNVYNISIVIILLKLLLINNEIIKDIVKFLKSAPGRMDIIRYRKNLIIVDYAHTPDAVEKIIKAVKGMGRIITLIGCGGNRDKTKRKIMGSIATKNSDYVILTSDNPRYEDPNDIIFDMIKDITTFNYEIEINRKKAIIKGIQKLDKNDIMLILGKGHEDYQEVNGVKKHFNDKETVLEYIKGE